VFTHENSERYGERNVLGDMVRSTRFGPIRVFVLQEELEISPSDEPVTFFTSPVEERGSVEKFFDELTIKSFWVYADASGTEFAEFPTRERFIDPSDTRVAFGRTDHTVVIDNVIFQVGAGIYRPGFWERTFSGDIEVSFRDISNGNLALGEVTLEIEDPEE